MNAYPVYEKCMQHQQGFAWPISDMMESSQVNGMLLLDTNDGRVTAIMAIKYITDEMMEHAKAQMDSYRQDADGNAIEDGYADA